MSKYPHVVGHINVDSSRWAKSLLSQMNFVKQWKTSSKVDIPDGARKEIEFLYLDDILSKVDNETMAAKGEPLWWLKEVRISVQ